MPAAHASECAAQQHAFASYHRVLYEHQDSLGLKSFGQFAVLAGIPDTAAFAKCLTEGDDAAIAADVATVMALGGNGTPTILVNGYQWSGLPTRVQLDSILQFAQANREVRW